MKTEIIAQQKLKSMSMELKIKNDDYYNNEVLVMQILDNGFMSSFWAKPLERIYDDIAYGDVCVADNDKAKDMGFNLKVNANDNTYYVKSKLLNKEFETKP